MKLYPNQLPGHLQASKNWKSGYLIFGDDQALVDQNRDRIVEAIAGSNAMQDMRLDKIEATEFSQQPRLLGSLIKAQSFFGGTRVVCIDKGSDQHNKILFAELDEWKEGFAHIVITANRLKPASALRKRFENDKNLVSLGIYTDHLDSRDISLLLKEAHLTNIETDALNFLVSVAKEQEPSIFKSLIHKLVLYKFEDTTPLSIDDIKSCIPEYGEAGLDRLMDSVANRKRQDIGPLFRKLTKQDREPVRVCLFAKSKFRNILTVASHEKGPDVGITKIKPPLFGPRQQSMLRQAALWGTAGAEWALLELIEVDKIIRGAGSKPVEAIMERTLHRIAGYH